MPPAGYPAFLQYLQSGRVRIFLTYPVHRCKCQGPLTSGKDEFRKVRTDSASFTFFRQRIARILSPWPTSASLTILAEPSAMRWTLLTPSSQIGRVKHLRRQQLAAAMRR